MKAVSTGLQTVYVYDIGGKLVAEYSSGAASVPPCHTCFLSTDHLGSTRLVTDENGTTVSRHDYIPFGEEIAANTGGRDGTFGTQDFVNQKFTGKERDQETGLDFFGARYMSGVEGRFVSPDQPLEDQQAGDPQSWNLYSYVRNNPLKNIDPFGEDCITTSNQSSSGVEVTTERGGSAETCSGTYVDGTVNTNSYQYNGSSLSYSFANDTTSGAGTIGFGNSGVSNDSGDISPFGAAVVRSVGARTDASYKLMGMFAGGSVLGGGAVAGGLAITGGSAALTTLGLRGAALLPIVPSAIDKLQKIGPSLQQATELVESPGAQKLIDNANGGNINVLQNVGDKVVRITLDPSGSRIISAGYMQSRNVANGIASGRFTPMQ
jgi:RHS repeat-associated protein